MWNDAKIQEIKTHLATGWYDKINNVETIENDIAYLKRWKRGLPSGWVDITITQLEKKIEKIKERNEE